LEYDYPTSITLLECRGEFRRGHPAQASFPPDLRSSHRPQGQWHCLNKPDAPDSRWAWGVWIVFLVETGSGRVFTICKHH